MLLEKGEEGSVIFIGFYFVVDFFGFGGIVGVEGQSIFCCRGHGDFSIWLGN